MIYPIILGVLAVVFVTGAYRLGRRFGRNQAAPARQWGPVDGYLETPRVCLDASFPSR